MKKYFFITSIVVGFIGCFFLLTAGKGCTCSIARGVRPTSKKAANLSSPALPVRLGFGYCQYECAGYISPTLAVYQNYPYNDYFLHVQIVGTKVPNYNKTYAGKAAVNIIDKYTGCMGYVYVPQREDYKIYCYYQEKNCKTDEPCMRWFKLTTKLSGDPFPNCFDYIYVDEEDPKGYKGACEF